MIVALADVSRKYAKYIPVNADTPPIIGEIHNIRAKEFVSIRAIDAGITNNAEINSVPMTRIVTRMVSDSMAMSKASIQPTRTPDTWATSGSNVANKSGRYRATINTTLKIATRVTATMSCV